MIVGIDLGSRRTGLVAALDVLPLHVQASVTVHVDPKGLTPAVDRIVACVRFAGAGQVVIEHAPLYAPLNKTPAELAAIAHAHEVCAILENRVRHELERLGVRVTTIPRATWAHRVVPHHRGGIEDALANAHLREHVSPEGWERLGSQDERDAAGTIVGWLLPAPRRAPRKRDRHKAPKPLLTPEERAERAGARLLRKLEGQRVRRGSVVLTDRPEAGCTCTAGHNGGGRHRRGCPLAPDAVRIAAAVARGSWLR